MGYKIYWILGLLTAISVVILGNTWGYSNVESNPLMVGVVMWGGVLITGTFMSLTIINYKHFNLKDKDLGRKE